MKLLTNTEAVVYISECAKHNRSNLELLMDLLKNLKARTEMKFYENKKNLSSEEYSHFLQAKKDFYSTLDVFKYTFINKSENTYIAYSLVFRAWILNTHTSDVYKNEQKSLF